MPTAQLSSLDPISSSSAIELSAVLIAVVLTAIRNSAAHEVTRTAFESTLPVAAPLRLLTCGCGTCSSAALKTRWTSLTRLNLFLELAGNEGELQLAALAHDLGLDRAADALGHHQPLQVADVGHRPAVDGDDQVLRAQPRVRRGAALDDCDDLDPALAAD